MGSSKKGISSYQLHRMLGVTYKTAWFVAHRIREAMRDGGLLPLGGGGGTVEAYREIGNHFAAHDAINHTEDEYVRREGDKIVSTNTVEGYC